MLWFLEESAIVFLFPFDHPHQTERLRRISRPRPISRRSNCLRKTLSDRASAKCLPLKPSVPSARRSSEPIFASSHFSGQKNVGAQRFRGRTCQNGGNARPTRSCLRALSTAANSKRSGRAGLLHHAAKPHVKSREEREPQRSFWRSRDSGSPSGLDGPNFFFPSSIW